MPGTEAITAFALLITAITGLVTSIGVILVNRRVGKVQKDTAETHIIVNQKATDNARFTAALVRQLVKHNIEVPIDQSIAPTEEEVASDQPYPS